MMFNQSVVIINDTISQCAATATPRPRTDRPSIVSAAQRHQKVSARLCSINYAKIRSSASMLLDSALTSGQGMLYGIS